MPRKIVCGRGCNLQLVFKITVLVDSGSPDVINHWHFLLLNLHTPLWFTLLMEHIPSIKSPQLVINPWCRNMNVLKSQLIPHLNFAFHTCADSVACVFPIYAWRGNDALLLHLSVVIAINDLQQMHIDTCEKSSLLISHILLQNVCCKQLE